MLIRVCFFKREGRDFWIEVMASNVQLELFPKKWYKKLTPAKLKDARQQLRTYAISKELDTGLNEVGKKKKFIIHDL